jgi:hypothetical protein
MDGRSNARHHDLVFLETEPMWLECLRANPGQMGSSPASESLSCESVMGEKSIGTFTWSWTIQSEYLRHPGLVYHHCVVTHFVCPKFFHVFSPIFLHPMQHHKSSPLCYLIHLLAHARIHPTCTC